MKKLAPCTCDLNKPPASGLDQRRSDDILDPIAVDVANRESPPAQISSNASADGAERRGGRVIDRDIEEAKRPDEEVRSESQRTPRALKRFSRPRHQEQIQRSSVDWLMANAGSLLSTKKRNLIKILAAFPVGVAASTRKSSPPDGRLFAAHARDTILSTIRSHSAGVVMNSSITLSPLTDSDAAVIRQWPPYPSWVEDLDYALRSEGWLDQFPESPANRRFAARDGEELIGFSLLVDLHDGEAEFYVALHPARLGAGAGRIVTQQTVARGFGELGLRRIHLKVRDWHHRAIHLYESVGFRRYGTAREEHNDKPVHFILMEMMASSDSGPLSLREDGSKMVRS